MVGHPIGVVRGLTECGVEVVPIRAEPDPLVRELARNAIAIRYLRPQRDARAAIKRARAAARASPGAGLGQHESRPAPDSATPATSTGSSRSAPGT